MQVDRIKPSLFKRVGQSGDLLSSIPPINSERGLAKVGGQPIPPANRLLMSCIFPVSICPSALFCLTLIRPHLILPFLRYPCVPVVAVYPSCKPRILLLHPNQVVQGCLPSRQRYPHGIQELCCSRDFGKSSHFVLRPPDPPAHSQWFTQ